jgi:hypothetical protein
MKCGTMREGASERASDLSTSRSLCALPLAVSRALPACGRPPAGVGLLRQVGNNWPVVMEGVVASVGGTGSAAGRAARLFFTSFVVASNLVLLNIAVAFILDVFAT